MSLPIRTTVADIDAVCSYLATKPTGATLAAAKAIVDKKSLDRRKLAALKYWGLIEDDGNKIRITDQGRLAVKDSYAHRHKVLLDVVRQISPYAAVIERAAHQREITTTATEVAANWHDNFTNQVSPVDTTLNAQAICFFHIAEGADLGSLTIGRKGKSTRFDFSPDALHAFIDNPVTATPTGSVGDHSAEGSGFVAETTVEGEHSEIRDTETPNNRIFITHGKDQKILNQVKELVAYGKFEPIVSKERETDAKAIPQKVMDDMRACGAAVIHVSAEEILYDENGGECPQINSNVLIEIGAAMALYGEKFILLVEKGINLPSNLQGLYECRYEGNELNMDATMKLLKAFNKF